MTSPTFNKERHVKYFLRCLKTLLPHQYTAGDGGRILLGFFVIAGLDLLGALESSTTPEERQGYINWIYHCQHPSGGFRGFTGTKFGDDKLTRDNEAWDPANVPSTFLALETLLVLGDDLTRLKRRECLEWLPKLQRKDGSFGELLGAGEEVEGGNDLRFCYCAAGIRYFLRGPHAKDVEDVKDINVSNLASFIQSCQVFSLAASLLTDGMLTFGKSYDGGMAETSFREAHGIYSPIDT
jgi:geranylgeranyl transferase type-1 subunit beta